MTNRTRSRLVNATPTSWGLPYQLIRDYWDGNTPMVQDLGMFDLTPGTGYSNGTFEEIKDEKIPAYGDKEVSHIRICFNSNVAYGADIIWLGGGTGYYTEKHDDGWLQKSTWTNLMVRNPWGYFNPSNPPESYMVRVYWPAFQEQGVVSRLYAQAYQPRVDVLLNLAEANEIPNAIRTLSGAQTFSRMSRLWGDERGGAKLQLMYRRFRALFVDMVLSDIDGRSVKSHLKARFLRAAMKCTALSGKLVSALGRETSGAYLAYQFGIAPLVADVGKLARYMDHVEEDYRRTRKGETKTVSVVISGKQAAGQLIPTRDTLAGAPGECSWWTVADRGAVKRYHLSYIESNPYKTEGFKKLDFLLRRFTSGGLASFAWERTPFSFVADWFVDLGPLIRGFDAALGRPQIDVRSSTVSTRLSAHYSSNRVVNAYRSDSDPSGSAYEVSSVKGIHAYDATWFTRKPLARDPVPTVTSDAFGKKRVALSSALLSQRILR